MANGPVGQKKCQSKTFGNYHLGITSDFWNVEFSSERKQLPDFISFPQNLLGEAQFSIELRGIHCPLLFLLPFSPSEQLISKKEISAYSSSIYVSIVLISHSCKGLGIFSGIRVLHMGSRLISGLCCLTTMSSWIALMFACFTQGNTGSFVSVLKTISRTLVWKRRNNHKNSYDHSHKKLSKEFIREFSHSVVNSGLLNLDSGVTEMYKWTHVWFFPQNLETTLIFNEYRAGTRPLWPPSASQDRLGTPVSNIVALLFHVWEFEVRYGVFFLSHLPNYPAGKNTKVFFPITQQPRTPNYHVEINTNAHSWQPQDKFMTETAQKYNYIFAL